MSNFNESGPNKIEKISAEKAMHKMEEIPESIISIFNDNFKSTEKIHHGDSVIGYDEWTIHFVDFVQLPSCQKGCPFGIPRKAKWTLLSERPLFEPMKTWECQLMNRI